MKKRVVAAVAVLLAAGWIAQSAVYAQGDDRPKYQRRWVWVMTNLLVDKEVDRVVALIKRSAAAGYNGIVISDYKMNFLDRMPSHYFVHAERVKTAAREANVELIPGVFSVGYSNGLLSHDPNYAEGMRVENAPFVLKGNEAVLASEPSALRNGGLEETRGHQFAGFGFQDEPGKVTFADHDVVREGKTSCRMENLGLSYNKRLIQPVNVRPHACYRLSCWVKTRDLQETGAFRLMAIGASGRQLSFQEGGLEATKDWTKIEVVFNSQDESKVNLYAGLWGAKSGTLWIDDLRFEELGLVNVLRRPGCPFLVKSADGATTYTEGDDFEPVRDPNLGQLPWPGEYEFNHPTPAIKLTKTSRIKPGDRLKVSWYHPVLTLSGYAACCLSEPKIYSILEDQAKRVESLFHPKTIFMQHDELRVVNWCAACQTRKLTPGALLADNVRRCQEILKKSSPNATQIIWSDMFDPTHNAVKGPYYLVNGSLEGSWNGLQPSTMIANWNGGKARASLEFFAKRGHSQIIAGYYDSDDNFNTWDTAASGLPGVIGFMYTTWQQRYVDLERYGRKIQREGEKR